MSEVLTVDEAAELAGVSSKQLYALIDAGVVPGARKYGRLIRLHRETFLEEFVELIGVEQAAELLRCSTDLIYQLAAAGEIPARKIGGAWRFHRRELITDMAGT